MVTLVSLDSLAPTPSTPAASSQAGKARASVVSKKPYDRPAAVTKETDAPTEHSVPSQPLSILNRPPPSFPTAASERSTYTRPEGSAGKAKVTAFQWKLYDLLVTLPLGKVSTYGQLASLLSSSPRAVGSALRHNPFAPTVPCHRIIASTLFIGGFNGEWKNGEAKNGGAFAAGGMVSEKLELLKREGVEFDGKGFLKDKGCLWDGKAVKEE
ncbi:hypothetical protein JCM10213_001813 [Rhodosporidiobolus nylandii]